MSRRDFLKISAVAAGVLAGGSTLLKSHSDEPVMVEQSRFLMGTLINLTLVAERRDQALAAQQAAFGAMERLIRIFDHRIAEGALGRLNRAGELANPPQELVRLLGEANKISEMTTGAFDITVKPVLDALKRGIYPGATELNLVDYRQVQIEPDRIMLLKPGSQITLDGIAKGRIVDEGIAALSQQGFSDFIVEAGGDLFARRGRHQDQSWKIGIAHPRPTQEDPREWIARLDVQDNAVATSGDYLHAFTSDYQYNHILDPRTGLSPSSLCSASVVARNTTLADALGTAVMVMGVEAGLELAARLADVEILMVTKNLELYKSEGFPVA